MADKKESLGTRKRNIHEPTFSVVILVVSQARDIKLPHDFAGERKVQLSTCSTAWEALCADVRDEYGGKFQPFDSVNRADAYGVWLHHKRLFFRTTFFRSILAKANNLPWISAHTGPAGGFKAGNQPA